MKDNLLQNLRAIYACLVIFAMAMFLTGCEGGLAKDSTAGDGVFASTGTGDGAIGGAAAADAQKVFGAKAAGTSTNLEDYKISPLDLLEITVFGVKEIDRTVQVSTTGMITLPLVKSVKAGGKTASQLERNIAQKLQATYLQDPQVSVLVKEFNSQKVTVDGAVIKPGIYNIVGSMSLLQAIAQAQGLNLVADSSGIIIFRNENGRKLAARFDLAQVRSGKIQDPELKAGDIVMVDESRAKTTLRTVKDALPLTGLFRMLLI
jgi:polysaccharide biosynthesis/export protein